MMRRSLLRYFVLVLLPALASAADKPLQPQSRVWILRALTAEFATLKRALPRGLEGLRLAADGKVDEKALEVQLTNNGQALRTGELAQITKVDFRKDRIIFEVNGGGKKKRRWFQNVEVGMGRSTGPVTPQDTEPAKGSSIALEFGKEVPDLTVEQLKEHLSPVFDFNQRSATLITTESWPKEVQEAVKKHEITAGMTREMVIASRGRPENKIREKKRGVEQETWVYGKVPSKILLVIFENDEVVEASEFIPGVASTRVPRMDDPPEKPPE